MIALLLALSITPAHAEGCIASVYSVHDADQTGTRTASGIPLNDGKATMAHKSLPLKSYATVKVLKSGRTLRLQVTDRGPYVAGRCVDLSVAAARALGVNGLAKVEVIR